MKMTLKAVSAVPAPVLSTSSAGSLMALTPAEHQNQVAAVGAALSRAPISSLSQLSLLRSASAPVADPVLAPILEVPAAVVDASAAVSVPALVPAPASAPCEHSMNSSILLDCVRDLHALTDQPSFVWDVAHMVHLSTLLNRNRISEVLQLLSMTKGVDKMAKFSQFFAKFSKNLLYRAASSALSMNLESAAELAEGVAERSSLIERSLSSVRRTLRLGKFVKEVRSIRKALGDAPERSTLARCVDVAQHLSSSVYFLLDHVTWAGDVWLFSQTSAFRDRLKHWKNNASILRLFLRLVQILNSPAELRAREHNLLSQLEKIVRSSSASNTMSVAALQQHRSTLVDIARQLRTLRSQKYFLMLDMVQWYTDLILLGKSIGWFKPSSLFVSLCGMFGALISIYQMWFTVFSPTVSFPSLAKIPAAAPALAPAPAKVSSVPAAKASSDLEESVISAVESMIATPAKPAAKTLPFSPVPAVRTPSQTSLHRMTSDPSFTASANRRRLVRRMDTMAFIRDVDEQEQQLSVVH